MKNYTTLEIVLFWRGASSNSEKKAKQEETEGRESPTFSLLNAALPHQATNYMSVGVCGSGACSEPIAKNKHKQK